MSLPIFKFFNIEGNMKVTNKLVDGAATSIKSGINYIRKHGGDVIRKGADHVSKHAPNYAIGGAALAAGVATKKYLYDRK